MILDESLYMYTRRHRWPIERGGGTVFTDVEKMGIIKLVEGFSTMTNELIIGSLYLIRRWLKLSKMDCRLIK